MTRTSILAAAAVAALLLPATAGARTHVNVGLGDQSAAMFSATSFTRLHVKKARYFVRWDAMRRADARAQLDAWVGAARAAHVRPLIHVSTNDLRPKHAKLISARTYRREVGRLVRHLKALGVRDFGAWNEANHKSQPTYRSAARAAAYYRQLRSICGSRCTIVALDVLDQRGVEGYIARFFHALPRSYRSRKLVIGIHNYSDTNRLRSRGTSSIIHTVRHYDRHAKFWLTETGGVVNFGRSFPCSTRRAASRTSYMFRLAKKYDRYVERLYAYNFFGADCRGFDAGLVTATGRPRPAYGVFRAHIRSFTR
ncbi:MAG: hypothetical protein ACXVSX_12505 [Solirubrobacteraceae bacterium]